MIASGAGLEGQVEVAGFAVNLIFCWSSKGYLGESDNPMTNILP